MHRTDLQKPEPQLAGVTPDDRYWAFISYSHKDRRTADWLHRALERYRIPSRLVGLTAECGPVPPRITPVFLDRVEMAAADDINSAIMTALLSSRMLIVLCSRASARSVRVQREIETFRRAGRGRILALILDGRPNAHERGGLDVDECFPPALRLPQLGAAASSPEPLAADLRRGKGGRQEALLKLIAGLLSLNLDQLRQRDFQRRRVQWATATVAGVMGMLLAFALALYAIGERDAALRAQSRLLIEAASARLNEGDVATAQAIVRAVLMRTPLQAANRAAALNAFQEARAADAQMAVLSGHSDRVWSANYSANGMQIVTASWDRTARIWDAQSGAQLLVLKGHRDHVQSANFSPDGSRVVTGSDDGSVRVWDAYTGLQLAVLVGHTGHVVSAEFSPGGTRIVTASWDKTARVWDSRTGKTLSVPSGHRDRVIAASFSADEQSVVTASDDKEARIWDWRTAKTVSVLAGHTDRVWSARFSPDGTHVVTASWDKTARIWLASSGRQTQVLYGHEDLVLSARYSPDATRIVTCSNDKTLRIWDVKTGREISILKGHAEALMSASYSPDGQQIVTASWDKTARIWDARGDVPIVVLTGHSNHVESVTFSPTGSDVLTAALDRTVRRWDTVSRTTLATIRGNHAYYSAAYSPDGRLIVTSSDDINARIWSADSGALLNTLVGHEDIVTNAGFSPDGARIVTGSWDKTARIWDARTGKQLMQLSGHQAGITNAAFSPDGRRVVTASWDKTARIWDTQTGQQLQILTAHADGLTGAVYSPDGNEILTSSNDNTARRWDASTGRPTSVLAGHHEGVTAATYSPDGMMIATASNDKTARLWDAHTNEQMAVIADGGDRVESIAFSPDGERLATASDDALVRVWNVPKVARIDLQIAWSEAVEVDPMPIADRVALGLTEDSANRPIPGVRPGCESGVAVYYDIDDVSRRSWLFREVERLACLAGFPTHETTARAQFQKGLALSAAGKYSEATRTLMLAWSSGYPAAAIALANLMTDPLEPGYDPPRALMLLNAAWTRRVTIAAYEAGHIYEQGLNSSADARTIVPQDQRKAWEWYQRGADSNDPSCLARYAEKEEAIAQADMDVTRQNQHLISAFRYYTLAARIAAVQSWPDDVWSKWRHRRASIGRLLARRGQMTEVAIIYRNAISSQ